MKRLVLPALLSLGLPVHPATAGSPPTRLVCNASGEAVLEVQFDGPRYADSIHLRSFDGSLVKSLLGPSEGALKFVSSDLQTSTTVGRCTATPTAATILSCEAQSAPRGHDFVLSTYDFQHVRSVGPSGDFSEAITMERSLKVDHIKLTVTKQRVHDPILSRDYTAAHIKLEMSGQSQFSSFSFTEERTLGEIVPEAELSPWERCAFVS